jgi:RNA ligase (TIGR02306 family)
MSNLKIQVQRILEITEHPNADKLSIAKISGWTTIVRRDQFKVDDLVVFIPPDSILCSTLHEFLNITNYCAELPKSNPLNPLGHRRVRAARLRGVPSYGTTITLEDATKYFNTYYNGDISDRLVEGSDLSTVLNITKYEPPIRSTAGDQERDSPQFHKYWDIENWRNYPDMFTDEQVVITEKIHGSNCRVGYCLDTIDGEWKFMAGSHKTRRKDGLYWEPTNLYLKLRDMIKTIHDDYDHKPVVVFGEIFGCGIQDMQYGLSNKKDFRVFDISIGGEYLDWPFMIGRCKRWDIPTVPVLYVGPYSAKIVEELTNGPAFQVGDTAKFKGREGIVIKSIPEKVDPYRGRYILKSVSDLYLARKDAEDNE